MPISANTYLDVARGPSEPKRCVQVPATAHRRERQALTQERDDRGRLRAPAPGGRRPPGSESPCPERVGLSRDRPGGQRPGGGGVRPPAQTAGDDLGQRPADHPHVLARPGPRHKHDIPISAMAAVTERGTSSSAVSRRFVALSTKRLGAFLERPLGGAGPAGGLH